MKTNAVTEYIKQNWIKTIWDNKTEREGEMVRLAKPYTVPCIRDTFTHFYYWDTYFTNLGLLLDGMVEQAENNLDNMKFFIDKIGFVPNVSEVQNRSQPPVFTRGVYDLYQHTKDLKIIEKYLDAIVKEFAFWENDRKTPCGLNAYGNGATNTYLLQFHTRIGERMNIEKEKGLDKLSLAKDLLAIAESGWDFNLRFMVEGNRFASTQFAHLDLNCLLYDAERKAAEMAALVGRKELSAELYAKAESRKALMDKYMLDKKSGIYYDYNFKTGEHGRVTSCASLYPYAVGLSDDQKAAKAVLEKLELPFGLSSCEEVAGEERYQWGYPSMWPTNVYFAFTGLDKIGRKEDGERVAKKYVDCLERVYETTGSLWEKYDAFIGDVSVTAEYKTPQMLGWTAGIYLFIKDYYGI
ncbi:MAG: hypothetical protein IJ506_03740 [Clostridia bacterium]|nr:hypothetical protein [Clostridia bacterium]